MDFSSHNLQLMRQFDPLLLTNLVANPSSVENTKLITKSDVFFGLNWKFLFYKTNTIFAHILREANFVADSGSYWSPHTFKTHMNGSGSSPSPAASRAVFWDYLFVSCPQRFCFVNSLFPYQKIGVFFFSLWLGLIW